MKVLVMYEMGAFWFAKREKGKKHSDTGKVWGWQGGILKAILNLVLNFLRVILNIPHLHLPDWQSDCSISCD